jgi:hypothetical protein
MITVLGLNRQNRTTGISVITLDMRNMPKSDANGTFETCPPILRMSVHRGTPEVAVVRPNRRE